LSNTYSAQHNTITLLLSVTSNSKGVSAELWTSQGIGSTRVNTNFKSHCTVQAQRLTQMCRHVLSHCIATTSQMHIKFKVVS